MSTLKTIEPLYGINEITIIPAATSTINSRKECNPYVKDNWLPLFASPMASTINESNYEEYLKVGIPTVIPRNIPLELRFQLLSKTFVAMSLDEFEMTFGVPEYTFDAPVYVCVDVAHGHMERLINSCAVAKGLHGDKVIIMTGNIAHPDTYYLYAKAGIDFVRVSVGSGNVCTTAANTGIYFPMGSLLSELYVRKQSVINNINNPQSNVSYQYKSVPKIIADGGFNNFDQIIKALALSADYVMLGKIIAKSEEACGETCYIEDQKYREYYGMSTKRAQKETGREGNNTAEGISTLVPIEYPIAKWTDNFKAFLKSAMSYSNSRTLEEFQRKAIVKIMTLEARNAYNK